MQFIKDYIQSCKDIKNDKQNNEIHQGLSGFEGIWKLNTKKRVLQSLLETKSWKSVMQKQAGPGNDVKVRYKRSDTIYKLRCSIIVL